MREAEHLLEEALNQGRSFLSEFEARKLARLYGIPVPNFRFAGSLEEALAAAGEIGYPVTLKVASPDIQHKTDVGGVIVGLPNPESLRKAFKEASERVRRVRPEARIEGFLVEETAPPTGIEVIVGGLRDRQFGPTVLFGLGGIFVEVLKDFSLRVCPVNFKDALEMLEEIQGRSLLSGFRGKPPVSKEKLASLILKVSKLMLEHPEVDQLDLNPVLAYPDKVLAVDVKVGIKRPEEGERLERPPASLEKLFNPKAVAVIGASPKPGKLGYNVLFNLLNHGFSGKVYPVNPREKEILKVECFKSILEVPGEVDVAVLTIPAGRVSQALEECGVKGVKFAIVEAAGFAELGGEGEKLQEALTGNLRKYGLRLVGPNCAGVVNLHNGFISTFAPLEALRKGEISIIAQAGIFAVDLLQVHPLRFGKIASLGNMADLDEADFLEYFAEDGETRVIGVYVEGVRRGRRFLEALRKASLRKPVVVLKGGKTREGSVKVKTHTASLAGNPAVWRFALKQHEAVMAESLEEFFNLLKFFSLQPPMEGPNLSILTYTGSMGILAVDRAVTLGLKIVEYRREALERLKEIAFPWTSSWNPLDLSFLAEAWQYKAFIETVERLKEVNGILCMVPILKLWELGKAAAEAWKRSKPLVFCIPMADLHSENILRFEEKYGVACYLTPEEAVNALAKSLRYHRWLKNSRKTK